MQSSSGAILARAVLFLSRLWTGVRRGTAYCGLAAGLVVRDGALVGRVPAWLRVGIPDIRICKVCRIFQGILGPPRIQQSNLKLTQLLFGHAS